MATSAGKRAPVEKQLRPGLRGDQSSAGSLIVGGSSLQALRREASHCQACDLWKTATQTVFGEGNAHARVMLVGEQPGDAEDVTGHPFVGPAGKLLDEALREAGIERSEGAAAADLGRTGLSVLILEARNRIGGHPLSTRS